MKMSSARIKREPVRPQLREARGNAQVPGTPAGENLGAPSSIQNDVSFLRLPEVRSVTGLSKTTVYALIRENDFPAPVRLGPRAVAWVRSEVRQWALGRVKASRSKG
jgi:prophage regulatory protein